MNKTTRIPDITDTVDYVRNKHGEYEFTIFFSFINEGNHVFCGVKRGILKGVDKIKLYRTIAEHVEWEIGDIYCPFREYGVRILGIYAGHLEGSENIPIGSQQACDFIDRHRQSKDQYRLEEALRRQRARHRRYKRNKEITR